MAFESLQQAVIDGDAEASVGGALLTRAGADEIGAGGRASDIPGPSFPASACPSAEESRAGRRAIRYRVPSPLAKRRRRVQDSGRSLLTLEAPAAASQACVRDTNWANSPRHRLAKRGDT